MEGGGKQRELHGGQAEWKRSLVHALWDMHGSQLNPGMERPLTRSSNAEGEGARPRPTKKKG